VTGRTGTSREDAPQRSRDVLTSTLWPVLRPRLGLVALGLLFMLLASACQLALPYLVKVSIDSYIVVGDLDGFAVILGLFAAASIGEGLFRRWQSLAVETAGQDGLMDLRMRVFRHLQRLPTQYYDRTPTGRLVGRVTTDIEALLELFSSGVVTVLGDLLFLGAALWILLTLSAELTLTTLLVVPLLVAVSVLVRNRARKAYNRLRSRISEMNAFLHEHVGGMSTVQAFGMERAVQGRFDGIVGGVRGAQLVTVGWESTLSAVTELLGSITSAVILWYGGGLALAAASGEGDPLTLGTLIAFVDYMTRFFGPLNDLSQKYTVLQNAFVASERIHGLLAVPPESEDAASEDPVSERPGSGELASSTAVPAAGAPRGEVVFEDVRFAYGSGDPVLRGLSFRVAPGEKVAIVGATGAGKTTILSLLTRLYDVQGGRILLDGVDVRDLPRRALRRAVGVVAQDVFLFRGTILDNIRLGHPDVAEADVLAAANGLHLDEIVRRFPSGYNEHLTERASNLSAGERQLIAFARMLVVAPVVLALDEATANVDSRTEELLQQALGRVLEGRTALIIAHRLSTVRDADRILVLDRGALVEQGSHDELVAKRGAYWRLHQLQFERAAPST